jgi:hypothetical protein
MDNIDNWIATYSGKHINVPNFNIDGIDIYDIAHSLSLKVRFNGHIKIFFSVAQHSLLVSSYCSNKFEALFGLLHDASEAYIVDIPSPLKKTTVFDEYRKLEKKLQSNIYEKFIGSTFEPAIIKILDIRSRATEASQLMRDVNLVDWNLDKIKLFNLELKEESPSIVEKRFLDRFFELKK